MSDSDTEGLITEPSGSYLDPASFENIGRELSLKILNETEVLVSPFGTLRQSYILNIGSLNVYKEWKKAKTKKNSKYLMCFVVPSILVPNLLRDVPTYLVISFYIFFMSLALIYSFFYI